MLNISDGKNWSLCRRLEKRGLKKKEKKKDAFETSADKENVSETEKVITF